MDQAKQAFEATKPLFTQTVAGLQNLRWEDIPEPVRNYIRDHPKLSAFQLVTFLLLACPGLVVAPAFGFLGFSSIGPVAGE